MQSKSIRKNFIQKIIETGMIYWIKSQCKTISEANLTLEGINFGLLKHAVSKIKFNGRDINFKDIFIKKISLETEEIIVAINTNKTSQGLISINNNFKIKVNLVITERELNLIIMNPAWQSMRNFLSENFLKGCKDLELKLLDGYLLISGINMESLQSCNNKISLECINGRIWIKDNLYLKLLPMDTGIYFDGLNINRESISASLSSIVKS